MNWVRDIGAATPFVSPSPQRFQYNAIKDGSIGSIPGLGVAVKTIPFFGFFDDRLKYPLLVAARLIVSLVITTVIAQFTLSAAWQDVVENQIIPVIAPAPEKAAFKETGNFFEDSARRLQIETQFLTDQAAHLSYTSVIIESLTGTIGLPFRFVAVYLCIFLLYLVFGNTIPQQERKYLKRAGELAHLGQELVQVIVAAVNPVTLNPQDARRLERIQQSLSGGITKHDREFIHALAQQYIFSSPSQQSAHHPQSFAQPPRRY